MKIIISLWILSFLLSFGYYGLNYLLMTYFSSQPWDLNIDSNYQPPLTIIVPTYNEALIIEYKLKNLLKIDYPPTLMQIIIVDSKSTDGTLDIINDFLKNHPGLNIQILIDEDKKGKSNAMNFALTYCTSDVIVVSDADCFWPSHLLDSAIPFLSDSHIGAITGPKRILNESSSWITKGESAYLSKMNLNILGESKINSTLFFEGGFCAFKRSSFNKFDPYHTGSDDCGTVIAVCENGLRSIQIPEAFFFSAFPKTLLGKVDIKLRRIIQLIRLYQKYFILIVTNRIKFARGTIIKNIYFSLISPLFLTLFIYLTIKLLVIYPTLSVVFLFTMHPKVSINLFEILLNLLLYFMAIFSLLLSKKTLFWKKPEDRNLVFEDALMQHHLI